MAVVDAVLVFFAQPCHGLHDLIPVDDIPVLKEAGIAEIFTPGANTGDIATWLREHLEDPSAN
jgi:hypothetical protein